MTEPVRAWALLVLVATSFLANAAVIRHEAGSADFGNLLHSALAPFAASYQPVGDQSQRPSQLMALALTASFLTTAAALVSAYFTLTRETWRQRIASHRSEAFVVIGDTAEAEAIVRSAREADPRASVVRVLPPGDVDPAPYVAAVHWPNALEDKRVVRLIENSRFTVVATASDAVNSTLAADIREALPSAALYFLLRSSALSRALRPRVLDGVLPSGGAFSSGENVAQFVATVIASHARAKGLTVRVALESRGGEEDLRKTIAAWLRDADRSQSLVDETSGARIKVVDPLADADVVVVVGQPSEVAARVLKGIRTKGGSPRLIGVLPPDLLASNTSELEQVERAEDWLKSSAGREIPASLVVDPERVGLHHRLVTEGPAVLWGRAYQQASGLVLGHGADWNFDEHGREEQSSIAAAEFLVHQLGAHGYTLVQTPRADSVWNPPTELIETLARGMHEAWRVQEWVHGGRTLRVAATGPDGNPKHHARDVDFDRLSDAAKDYNRRVVAEVYPAMAAMVGYRIRPRV